MTAAIPCRNVAPMTCESCGGEADELFGVRRSYPTPAGPDGVPGAHVLDEVEHWCFVCLTHYPHVPADGVGGAAPAS